MPSCRNKQDGEEESSLDGPYGNDEANEAGKKSCVSSQSKALLQNQIMTLFFITEQEQLTLDFHFLNLIPENYNQKMSFLVLRPSLTNCTDLLIYWHLRVSLTKYCVISHTHSFEVWCESSWLHIMVSFIHPDSTCIMNSPLCLLRSCCVKRWTWTTCMNVLPVCCSDVSIACIQMISMHICCKKSRNRMSAAGLMRSVISAQTHIVSVCMQPLSALSFLPIIFLSPSLSLIWGQT